MKFFDFEVQQSVMYQLIFLVFCFRRVVLLAPACRLPHLYINAALYPDQQSLGNINDVLVLSRRYIMILYDDSLVLCRR